MNEIKFIERLNKAIRFHGTNQNDPLNIGNAVICSLIEVRDAFQAALIEEDCKPYFRDYVVESQDAVNGTVETEKLKRDLITRSCNDSYPVAKQLNNSK